MPRTKTADRGRKGVTQQRPQSAVAVSGRSHPLARAGVMRAVDAVLRGERRTATISIAFLGQERMARLNARWKRKRRPTDVLAFALRGPDGALAGDVYVCPWVAARESASRGIPLRQELRRLVVHGVLHVLGYDHPEGERRTASPMWRLQERYLARIR